MIKLKSHRAWSVAPEGKLRLSFRRLAKYMTFSSHTATLSARWDFKKTISKMAEPPKIGVRMVVFLTEVDFRRKISSLHFIVFLCVTLVSKYGLKTVKSSVSERFWFKIDNSKRTLLKSTLSYTVLLKLITVFTKKCECPVFLPRRIHKKLTEKNPHE